MPRTSDFDQKLEDAKALLDANEPDAAHGLCVELLNEQPENPLALHIIASVYSRAERYGLALNIYKRITDISPRRFEAWNNYGMTLAAIDNYPEARKAFHRANDLSPNRPEVLANIALTHLEEGEREKAIEVATKSLKTDPEHAGARGTLGFAQLGLHDWRGWKNYHYTFGGKFRKPMAYGDEVLWDGSPGKRLVIYGEQGLGDEIMYASCINEAIAISEHITIDCDARLEGLFKRSFPQAEVHGTRREKEVDWIKQYDASCPIGRLPEFFRNKDSDFKTEPYLIPDPERVFQWKTLFKSYGKPVIGICWTGGSKHNQPHRRTIDLDDFAPLFAKDAVFVSLQYNDTEPDPRFLEFKRATRTPDYDDTAGLVAALDHVVGIHTSVHHLAGAMGVPATILVPEKCSWIYGGNMLWYKSNIHRKKSGETWKATIGRLDAESICRLRPEGSGGLSHVLPVSDREINGATCYNTTLPHEPYALQRRPH